MAPPGTDIKGATRLGPFTGNRAYWGVVGFGEDIFSPHIMIVSPEADPAAEFQNPQGIKGAVVTVNPLTDPFDQWPGEWVTWAQIAKNSMFGGSSINVVITGLAGNWDAPDPADPPRVVGSFEASSRARSTPCTATSSISSSFRNSGDVRTGLAVAVESAARRSPGAMMRGSGSLARARPDRRRQAAHFSSAP